MNLVHVKAILIDTQLLITLKCQDCELLGSKFCQNCDWGDLYHRIDVELGKSGDIKSND